MHRDPHHLNVRFSFQGPSGRLTFRCGGEESRRPTSSCQPKALFLFQIFRGDLPSPTHFVVRGVGRLGWHRLVTGPSGARTLHSSWELSRVKSVAAKKIGVNRASCARLGSHVPHRVSTRRQAREGCPKTSEDLLGAERGRQWKPKRNQQLEDAARKREADFFGQRVRPADRVGLPGLWGKLWTVLAPGRPSRDAASRGTSALPLACSARVGGHRP